jgi:16S rRNA (guanine966-N2)-methyltransferase
MSPDLRFGAYCLVSNRQNDNSKLAGLRIVGGHFRGRRLEYGGDTRVRPMKDRVREAVFNLLGDLVRGKHALDLFAGTGALGLEAVSRGAIRATMVEQHYPTAEILRRNIATLEAQASCEVITGNVFLRSRWQHTLSTTPWLVFSSPPYVFYVQRQAQMLDLIGSLMQAAPAQSIFVVEADRTFDFGLLPDPANWDIREYPPATVGIRYP